MQNLPERQRGGRTEGLVLTQSLGQLDPGSGRIGDEGHGNLHVLDLPVRAIELDAFRLQSLAERLEVLDLETDVIEAPSACADDARRLGETDAYARQVHDLEAPAH